MHFYSSIVLAIMATAAAAAPSPQPCQAGYISAGGGDGFLCYKVTCNRDIVGKSNKQVKASSIQDCLNKCYNDGNCWTPSFESASRTCFFHKGQEYPLKKADGFIATTWTDNGKCL